MNIAALISSTRRASGLTAQQLALMTGVAPSTITRIENGASSPSFDLAQAILAVLGIGLGAKSVADRDAILAVRRALDPEFPVPSTEGAEVWLDRWTVLGLVDPSRRAGPGVAGAMLMERAGRAAPLYRRPDRVDLAEAAGVEWFTVAEILHDTAGVDWALTGSYAANLFAEITAPIRPTFYVCDPETASRAIAEKTGVDVIPKGVLGKRISLLPFDGVAETGRYADDDGLWIAQPDQVVIDCYGGMSRMPEQADALLAVRRGDTL